jgi:hypothetical protein
LGVSALVVDAVEEEERYQQLFHLEKEEIALFDTACQMGQGRGRKLATEDSKPVGSGETIYAFF